MTTAGDEPQPPPEDADLGGLVEAFAPATGNIIAGFILSALLVAGGAAAVGFPLHAAYAADWNLPVNVKKGWSWLAVGLVCLVGVVLVGLGVGLAMYARWLLGHRVEVRADGFRYGSRHAVETVLWADVALVRETVLHERPPVLKGPAKLLLPKLKSTSYTVVTSAGKEYGFDGDSVRAIGRFGKVLRAQAAGHSLAWETVDEHA